MSKEFKTASKVSQQDNTVLLGIDESTEVPVRFDTYNVLKVFNVRAYGAKGDGVTDDTDAIQSAIDACASQGGGKVFFPVGVYIIGGILKSANGNAQIGIPPIEFSTGNYAQITLEGESEPSKQGLGGASGSLTQMRTGVILISTITGSGTRPSVIEAKKSTATNFNNNTVFVSNIRLLTTVNGSNQATMSGFNFIRSTAAIMEHVVVGLNISTGDSNQASDGTFGIAMPLNNSNTNMSLKNCLVAGYKHGYVLGEHVQILNSEAMGCEFGFTQMLNYFPNIALRCGVYWCKHAINTDITDLSISPVSSPTTANIIIQSLAVEWASSLGKWYDNTTIINDSSNLLRGSIGYHITKPGFGVDNSVFTKNGGTNIVHNTTCPQAGASDYDVSGSTGGNVALQNLLAKLEERGIIIDSTT